MLGPLKLGKTPPQLLQCVWGGQLEMFGMTDHSHLYTKGHSSDMALSLRDFNRKKRLFLKWIVTAKFKDNRLAKTRLHFPSDRKPLWLCLL